MAKKKSETLATPQDEQATAESAQANSGMEGSRMPAHLKPVKYTGRKPRIGEDCLYWMAQSELTGGGLRPRPATLTAFDRGGWNANVQRIGGSMYGRSGLQFSDTPRHNCLTWIEAQDDTAE